MHRPGQMQGKGDLEPEAGVGTSMLTMGSVPLGLEVLRFYRRFWVTQTFSKAKDRLLV